jgi:hypothetical protein
MNNFLKVILAILGGCNVIFSLFAPMAIALLWVLKFGFENMGSHILVILAILTTIYKALDYLFVRD